MDRKYKLGFVVFRINALRTLGPIIFKAAGDPTLEVVIIVPSFSLSSKKGLDPTIEKFPNLLRERCEIKHTHGIDEFISTANTFDALISTIGPSFLLKGDAKRIKGPIWCAVFDAGHSCFANHHFFESDMTFWPSQYYLDIAVSKYTFSGSAERETALSQATISGWARADNLNFFNKGEIRKKLGLPLDKPLVLLIPDTSLLTYESEYYTEHYRYVWMPENPFIRVFMSIFRLKSIRAVRQALSFSHNHFLDALRAFCDKNEAELVLVPRREKSWNRNKKYTDHELFVADHVIDESEDFPQTLILAMKAVDLAVAPYCSGCFRDAFATKTPYLTIDSPDEFYIETYRKHIKYDFYPNLNIPGVNYYFSTEEFIKNFSEKDFADFNIDENSYQKYMKNYVGFVDGKACERIISAVKKNLQVGFSQNTVD